MDRRRLAALLLVCLEPARVLAAAPETGLAAYAERLRALLASGDFEASLEAGLQAPHDALRARQGLGPLAVREDLRAAARAHAADLLARAYFAHLSPEGQSAAQRCGVLSRTLLGRTGENIALVEGGGPPSAATFAALWAQSPHHLKNILNPDWRAAGFGVARRGERTAAVAVFSDVFDDLSSPVPLRPGGLEAVSKALRGASRPLLGWRARREEGGPSRSWPTEEPPPPLGPGAWRLEALAPDAGVRGRFWIIPGPIFLLKGS